MKAAAVVVNFNGGGDLERCLAALAAQTERVDVVLVDCASTDGSRALAERPPAGVVGVPLADNRGYAGGCNAGLAAAGERAAALREGGPRRAARFTWRECARRHVQVWRGVAGR